MRGVGPAARIRAHVVVGDPRGIEREDPLLEHRVHRERPQDGVLLQVPRAGSRPGGADGARRAPGSGEREQDRRERRSGGASFGLLQAFDAALEPGDDAVHVARENAAVRNDTPTCSVSRAVVTAKYQRTQRPGGHRPEVIRTTARRPRPLIAPQGVHVEGRHAAPRRMVLGEEALAARGPDRKRHIRLERPSATMVCR